MGGLTKEFFFLLSEEIFDKKRGLFVALGPNNSFLHPSTFAEEVTDLFFFVGQVMAKSVLQNQVMDGRFSNILCKMLSQKAIVFDDFQLFDPKLHEQFVKLLVGNVDDFDLYFEYDVEIQG